MAAVEVPQTLEYMGGQLNAVPILEVENFTNWEKRFMCHMIGIEPQFENIIKNGPFIPMVAGQRKPEGQWTGDVRKAANLDQQLKSLIMSILPNDQMNSDFQDSPDDEEDTRSSHEYLIDLEEEYQARALLAKSKRFFKNAKKVPEMVNGEDLHEKVLKPWLPEAKDFILSNHDTGRILPVESQRNIIDPLVAVTNSSATDYDSADESSVCSTPLPPLKKLDGAKPVSRRKTIKSILKSKSTFKVETLKYVIINEPSSAPAKGSKISSALKVDLAPVSKLKSVKIKDDPPLSIVMKN
ncbi:hypothetical protein Tco_0740990 [Tanacetum coccineum]